MTYLLDTNVWSDIARGVGRAGRKLSVAPMAQVLISAPTVYELRRLPRQAKAWPALNRFLNHVLAHYEIAPLDASAAEAAASIAAARRAQGRPLHHLDAFVAGIAMNRGATLVTRDADFAGIAGLKVEDWS